MSAEDGLFQACFGRERALCRAARPQLFRARTGSALPKLKNTLTYDAIIGGLSPDTGRITGCLGAALPRRSPHGQGEDTDGAEAEIDLAGRQLDRLGEYSTPAARQRPKAYAVARAMWRAQEVPPLAAPVGVPEA
ncbi:hypothetical protein ACFZAT_32095 [Streptomyces sp. NPDC008163]|uniref:hypothetical protein n=1 Tax=Streptomyces sp. NPDC008163 TaxID=3364818 RepID=UPI0036F09333